MDTIKQVGYQSKQRELTDDELDIIIHRLIELMDTTDNPMMRKPCERFRQNTASLPRLDHRSTREPNQKVVRITHSRRAIRAQ